MDVPHSPYYDSQPESGLGQAITPPVTLINDVRNSAECEMLFTNSTGGAHMFQSKAKLTGQHETYLADAITLSETLTPRLALTPSPPNSSEHSKGKVPTLPERDQNSLFPTHPFSTDFNSITL